jgi:hypothetical protein
MTAYAFQLWIAMTISFLAGSFISLGVARALLPRAKTIQARSRSGSAQ